MAKTTKNLDNFSSSDYLETLDSKINDAFDKFKNPTEFSEHFCEMLKKSKPASKEINEIVKEAITKDPEVVKLIKEIIESNNNETWKNIQGKIFKLIYSVVLLLIGSGITGMVTYILK